MSRLTHAVAAVAIVAAAVPGAATAHKGSVNFESQIRAVEPQIEGLEVSVLSRDDRLLAVYRGQDTLVVLGYDGEPYARLSAGGKVEVNERSPAVYLNEERYAGVEVPEIADAKAPPRWKRVSGTGRFEWHDHRIHWMAKTTPPQVRDESERQKVFDWSVPVQEGDQRSAIKGTLSWTPSASPGGMPAGAIAGLAALGLAGVAAAAVVRRRRGPGNGAGGADASREAW